MSEQFWLTVIQTIAAGLAGYWAYRKSMAATQKNADGIKDVHGIVNSQRTEMVARIEQLENIIRAAGGAEKVTMDDQLTRPASTAVTNKPTRPES
jgi:phosphoglycerate dehydrogenase-like enzyme